MSDEELKQWKENFVAFMCKDYGTDEKYAIMEYEAYVESVGIDDLDTYINAVYECVDGWDV